MNNHSVKFEYKGMKTVRVEEYTAQTLSKHFAQKYVLSSRPQNMKINILEMYTKSKVHIFNV